MNKTKQTAEQLLARRMEKVNKTKAEWERKDLYAKQMAGYAQSAKEVHLEEVEKADRMKERIEQGREAVEMVETYREEVRQMSMSLTMAQKKTDLDYLVAVDKLEKAEAEIEQTRDDVAKMFYGFA